MNSTPKPCSPLLTLILAALLLSPAARADEQTEFFEKRIRPVLLDHCLKCHGEKKSENNLRVDSLQALTKGGDIGPAIVPGDPEKSLLIIALRYDKEDLQMPPKAKLDDAIIADLTKWIKDGAHWPPSDNPSPSSRSRRGNVHREVIRNQMFTATSPKRLSHEHRSFPMNTVRAN